jgi:hypothetical protein
VPTSSNVSAYRREPNSHEGLRRKPNSGAAAHEDRLAVVGTEGKTETSVRLGTATSKHDNYARR